MQKLLALWKRPQFRIGLGLFLFLVLAAAVGGIYLTQVPPEQPIQFPHSFHVGTGAQCLYCHPGAATGPVAGLPSSGKCWGCHQQIAKPSAELDKLAGFIERNESIPWVPVAIQPDFVHFNHRPHVAAGVDCKTCHGDLSQDENRRTPTWPEHGLVFGLSPEDAPPGLYPPG